MLSSYSNSLSILCFLFLALLWGFPFCFLTEQLDQPVIGLKYSDMRATYIIYVRLCTALNTSYGCVLNIDVLHTGNARNEYLGMFIEKMLFFVGDSAVGIRCFF